VLQAELTELTHGTVNIDIKGKEITLCKS
jgi:hypothetical protein